MDTVYITGHTDQTGNLSYNKELSQKRAEEVKSFFIENGATCHFISSSKAYFQPLSSDTSEVGKQLNRRVEIIHKRHIEIWVQKVQVFPITNDDWYKIKTENGCFLKISPNSVKTGISDSVYIQITEFNNPAEYIANELPMSYAQDNEIFLFESEQMMKIDAFSKDKVELQLNKLFELECPDVDTTGGVHFYELKEKKQKLENLRFEYEFGEVETTEKPKVKEVEEEEIVEEEILEEKRTEKITSKPKEKPKKKKRRFRFSFDRIELPIDTGRVSIDIDTGRINLDLDTLYSFSKYQYDTIRGGCDPFMDPSVWSMDFCKSSKTLTKAALLQTKKILEKEKPIDAENLDFHTFCQRFASSEYIGGKLIENYDGNKSYWYTPEWKIRKRLFRHQMTFKLKYFPDHQEYMPLRKTKWVVNYGDKKVNKDLLSALEGQIVDFRVFKYTSNLANYYSKYDYDLVLKTEDGFYPIPVKPKKNIDKTFVGYRRYQYTLSQKESEFNGKLSEQFKTPGIIPMIRLHNTILYLNSLRKYRCDKNSFTGSFLLPNKMRSNIAPNYPSIVYSEYGHGYIHLNYLNSWIKSVNENKAAIINQIDYLANNFDTISSYLCKIDPCPPTGEKWRYHSNLSNDNSNRIIRIGIGIYNFDRLYNFSNIQKINQPILIDSNRNIVLSGKDLRRLSIYTIIPDFKGLLKHNSPPRFAIIQGKLNVIYFQDKLSHKHYKAVFDLRDGRTFSGNDIVVKDITENAQTLKGLVKELESVGVVK